MGHHGAGDKLHSAHALELCQTQCILPDSGLDHTCQSSLFCQLWLAIHKSLETLQEVDACISLNCSEQRNKTVCTANVFFCQAMTRISSGFCRTACTPSGHLSTVHQQKLSKQLLQQTPLLLFVLHRCSQLTATSHCLKDIP